MKKVWIILSSIVAVVVLVVILNQKFMFNPLSFSSDEVTYKDWSNYTYPAKIEYLYWDNKNGWTIGSESSNKKELKFIFSAMKESLEQGKIPQEEFHNSVIERDMKLIIRRSDGLILFQFDYYEGGNIANIGNGNFIKLPSDLKDMLLEKTFNYF
ncbi:MAG: hypothetical protein ACK4M9_19375 [Anaerobacillus sp.]|uniref:hypothetical protein n=1 Tax=Anaerobacillus sp. TaxID=1872506 RepID=UPI0039189DA1